MNNFSSRRLLQFAIRALLLGAAAGAATPASAQTEPLPPGFTVNPYAAPANYTPGPNRIVKGPDGNIWITYTFVNDQQESTTGYIGQISPTGQVLATLVTQGTPTALTSGPAGDLSSIWFIENVNGVWEVGRISAGASPAVTFEVVIPQGQLNAPMPNGIANAAAKPDNGIYLTDTNNSVLWRVSGTAGNLTWTTIPIDAPSYGIALGPDNNIWFTEYAIFDAEGDDVGNIAYITPPTSATVTFPLPQGYEEPSTFDAITTGPDQSSVWFSQYQGSAIYSISTGVAAGTVPTLRYTLGGGATLNDMTLGPDLAIWFTQTFPPTAPTPPALGRIALNNGNVAENNEPVNGNNPNFVQPYGIAAGPNNNDLWFNDSGAAELGDAVIIPRLLITPVALPNAQYGQAYQTSLAATASGGTQPYVNWQVPTGSSLPTGLTLDASSGVISGTPTGPLVTTNFNVTVMDSNPSPFTQTASPQQFTIVVSAGPPAAIAPTSGGGQSAPVTQAFSNPLMATVTDSGGNPVPGVSVTFSAPGSGPSGTFSGNATVQTNASGVATSPAFTANAIAGSYNVTATVNGISTVFALTNTPGPPNTITPTSGGGQYAQVTNPFTNPLVATVKDANGNLVPAGVNVTFSAPSAVGAPSGTFATGGTTAIVPTNAAGTATSPIFTANATAGGYNVTASVNSSITASYALTNTAGPPASITATSGGGQSAQVNHLFANRLLATVKDANNNPVSGASVTFSAPGSGPSATFSGNATVQTNASGVATSPPFTANATAGSYNVTATAANVSSPASFALTNTPGAAATIIATSGGGQSAQVNNAFASRLVATVTDANNNPIPNVNVTFTAPPSGASGTFATGITAIVQTNASGVATAPVFTANATAGGPYTVSASVNGVSPSASFSLTNTAGSPATITPTSGGGQNAQVNHAFLNPLVATVKDAIGNLVSNVNVTFSAPASGASGTFAGNATVKTNASGVATSPMFTANATAGSYSVTASVAGISASYALTNTSGPPGSITATSGGGQSAPVNSAFLHPLVATVKDANNNPVSGVSVTFSAPSSGAGGTFTGSATVKTNASGVATSPAFTANATAGTYTVTASAANVSSPASFALTNTPGAAATIIATSGGGQSAQVSSLFSNPLIVTVKDSGGNLVSAATVTFTAPASGASGTFAGGATTASVKTNASGVATSPSFTANSTAGSYSVAASVTGVTGSATFALTNVAGAPGTITATSGGGQSALVGAAFNLPLVATVKDASGNLISGASVTFTAPASGASGTFAVTPPSITATVQTNASGVATSPAFTANATSGGPYTVTASVAGLATPASFALTNLPGSKTVTPTFTLTGLPSSQAPGSNITNATITVSPASTFAGALSVALSPTASGFPANNNGDAGFGTGFGTKPATANISVTTPSTSVPFPTLDPGTVAGSLSVTLTVTGQTPTTSTVTIAPLAPIIEAGSVQITNVTSTGFDVELVATSTTLDLKSATFTFAPAAGAQISGTSTFTADVSTLLPAWLTSSNYQYGGAFSLSIPFTISGPASAIGSVSVTLTNSVGTSPAVSGTP